MMLKLALAFGVLFILMGVLVGVAPEHVLSSPDWESQSARYGAAAFRLFIGIVLILAAPASKSPIGFRIIGAMGLLGAMFLMFISLETWVGLVRWMTVEHLTLYRIAGGAMGILLGGFITYAAQPGGRPSRESKE